MMLCKLTAKKHAKQASMKMAVIVSVSIVLNGCFVFISGLCLHVR